MSLEAIRAAIVAVLQRVPDIGRVHDFERYAANLNDLKAIYVATIDGQEQLRGWFVRRLTTTEITPALGIYDDTHAWEIRGYMALADGAQSEKIFDGLIEAIRAAFRQDENLGGVVDTTITPQGEGLALVESGPVLFAGVLCHAARLRLMTKSSV